MALVWAVIAIAWVCKLSDPTFWWPQNATNGLGPSGIGFWTLPLLAAGACSWEWNQGFLGHVSLAFLFWVTQNATFGGLGVGMLWPTLFNFWTCHNWSIFESSCLLYCLAGSVRLMWECLLGYRRLSMSLLVNGTLMRWKARKVNKTW